MLSYSFLQLCLSLTLCLPHGLFLLFSLIYCFSSNTVLLVSCSHCSDPLTTPSDPYLWLFVYCFHFYYSLIFDPPTLYTHFCLLSLLVHPLDPALISSTLLIYSYGDMSQIPDPPSFVYLARLYSINLILSDWFTVACNFSFTVLLAVVVQSFSHLYCRFPLTNLLCSMAVAPFVFSSI
jgi:hypothetical protein